MPMNEFKQRGIAGSIKNIARSLSKKGPGGNSDKQGYQMADQGNEMTDASIVRINQSDIGMS